MLFPFCMRRGREKKNLRLCDCGNTTQESSVWLKLTLKYIFLYVTKHCVRKKTLKGYKSQFLHALWIILPLILNSSGSTSCSSQFTAVLIIKLCVSLSDTKNSFHHCCYGIEFSSHANFAKYFFSFIHRILNSLVCFSLNFH